MEIDTDRLKNLRLKQLLTQVDLAERAGLTESTINRLEQGRHPARISTVRKLASALGVPPADLLTTAPESPAGAVEKC